MSQSGYIVQLSNSRMNILDILKVRGFDVSKYEGANIAEVHAMEQHEQLDMLLENKENNKKVYIKYHLAKTLRPNNIYDYTSELFDDEQVLTEKDDLIIISRVSANDTIENVLRTIWNEQKQFVIVFSLESLQFNILEHTLVPPHRVLSEEEANVIRKKYNIMNDSQIPDISRFGPVSLAIGIRPGELCEILRPSKTAITAPFYRICSA